MTYNVVYSDDYLAHHGILGQKWGVRRYQNEDGTLTSDGKNRYNSLTQYGRDVKVVSDHRSGIAGIKKEYRSQKSSIKKSELGKSEKKSAIKDLKVEKHSALRENTENTYKAMRDNGYGTKTQRGQRVAISILEGVGSIGLSTYAQYASYTGDYGKAITADILSGVLGGMSIAGLSNAYYTSKQERKGSIYG